MHHQSSFAGLCVSASLLLTVGACSSVSDLLSSETDEFVAGETIAVLALEENLVADERIADLPVNLPGAYTNSQWPQPGGAPTNAMQHLELEGQLNRVWQRNAGVGNRSNTRLTASPVLAGGRIFVLDAEAQVLAHDAETGERIWRTSVRREGEAARAGFGGGVAVAVDRVIATTGFGDIIALNAETGEELWRREVGIPIRTAPTVVAGRAFVVTTDNQLLAVDTSNGNVLWNQRAFQESAGLLAPTSPAATNDVVVAPFTSGELDAVRIQTGSLAWSDQLSRTGNFTPLANINAIAARPVIADGRVYAISHSGRFVAIDLRTGERIWTANVPSTQTPWIAGNFAFVVTLDAELVCISTRDGRVRWITQMDQWKNERRETGGIQYVGPVLISGRLVVISSEGNLEEYSPETGEQLNSIRVGDPVSLPPIVANNTLYVYSDDADLIAFRGLGDERPTQGFLPNFLGNDGPDESEAEAEPGVFFDPLTDDVMPAPVEDSGEAESETGDEEEEGGRGWFRWPWSSQ